MEQELKKELDDNIAKLKELYIDLDKKNNLYQNYIYKTKHDILGIFRLLNIEKYGGVKAILKPKMKSLTVENVMMSFSDIEIAKMVVCDINVEKTIENITLKLGYSENMAKSVLRNLLENYEYKTEDLEILK